MGKKDVEICDLPTKREEGEMDGSKNLSETRGDKAKVDYGISSLPNPQKLVGERAALEKLHAKLKRGKYVMNKKEKRLRGFNQLGKE